MSLVCFVTAHAKGRISAQNSVRLLQPPPGSTDTETLLVSYGWNRLVESGQLRRVANIDGSRQNRISFTQYYDHLPVIGGRLVVRTDADGNVLMVHSSLATWQTDVVQNFLLTPEDAVGLAVKLIGRHDFVMDPLVDKVVLPVNGVPVFGYRVRVSTKAPTRAMEYFFDGANGALLLSEDRLKRIDGHGLVFDPDPKSALQNDTLEDNDDDSAAIPVEAYTEVTLSNISYDDDSLLVLTGRWADTSPTENRYRSESGEFLFDRSNDHFEEVMAYYHINRQALYWRDLNFGGVPWPQLLDINRFDDDASFFNPQTRIITTGRGGVDDAEDADVLIHEYTHSLIEAVLPNWRGGETGLLAEGLCDYFAGDYSMAVAPDFEPMQIYNWDGHNQFWDGRILDSDYQYPEDCQGDIHDAGQLWSSLLTEIRLTGDRDEWNRVVVDHLYNLADSASVTDAIWALLVSDAVLTGGTFRAAIVSGGQRRGIIAPGEYVPEIRHTPPRDTENQNVSTEINVVIQADFWIDLDYENLWLIYHFENTDPESLLLEPSPGLPEVFHAVIPAPNRETEVSYYFFAADQGGVFSVDPPAAPEEQYHFHIGPDRIPPVILNQDFLPDSVFPEGEALFGVTVRDNIAIAEVKLIWYDVEMSLLGETVLISPDGKDGAFSGRIHWNVARDETVFYRVRATDAANQPNIAQSELRSFTIRPETTLDDFERSIRQWQTIGWIRTDRESYSGEWSLIDRQPEENSTPREAIAEINQTWRFANMGHARLNFVERHIFSQAVMEHGSIEILEEGRQDWQEIFTIAGYQGNWMNREVNLDRWARGNSPAIRLRFRTVTPEGARQSHGWIIDDLRLRVGNIVSAQDEPDLTTSGIKLEIPFPNPTNGFVNFKSTASKSGEVCFFDITGREVLSYPILVGSQITGVNLDKLPAGVYWMKAKKSSTNAFQIILLK